MLGPYHERLKQLTDDGTADYSKLLDLMQQPELKLTQFVYVSPLSHYRTTYVSHLLQHVTGELDAGRRGICIVENASPAAIEALGNAWQIDPELFNIHCSNPRKEDLWHKINWDHTQAASDIECLDGVFEYRQVDIDRMKRLDINYFKREIFLNRKDNVSVDWNTRISYGRVHELLYLFLTDATMHVGVDEPDPPILHLPYARNYAGVHLPGLKEGRMPWQEVGSPEPICVPLDVLTRSYRYQYQIEYLFSIKAALPAPAVLYLLTSSTWGDKMNRLETTMEQVSFKDIRRPNLRLTDYLHDIRSCLHFTRKQLSITRLYVPQEVKDFFETLITRTPELSKMHSPVKHIDDNIERVTQLQSLLLETFDILVSTLAVQESQTSVTQAKESLKQTEQSILLTRLAALYLPVSAATGIFGMNLKDINGSNPQFWAFLAVFFGFLILTALAMWSDIVQILAKNPRYKKHMNERLLRAAGVGT